MVSKGYKALIFFLILHAPALAAGPAMAQTEIQDLAEKNRQLNCQNEGLAAQNIMLMRQSGWSKTKVNKSIIPMDGFDESHVVSAAFAVEVLPTAKEKAREVDKFRNRYTIKCLMRDDPA